jgi:uncharacterized protein involved in response to NO
VDGVYVSMLLGGATPLILAVIAIANYQHKGNDIVWQAAVRVSLLLWLYAVVKAVAIMHTTSAISKRIIEYENQ